MPTNENTIEILVADDTLDVELGWEARDVANALTQQLLPLSSDVDQRRPHVTFINDVSTLMKAVATKPWDFIALDNKWLPTNEEFGFNLAKTLRNTEGPNRETPLCIFTNQNWLRQPDNINQVYKLDTQLGNVGSFADFFPKAEKPPPGNPQPWIEFFAAELLVRMKACFLLRSFRQRITQLDNGLATELGMVGISPPIREVIRTCQMFAMKPKPVPVLITGESGTGKEIVARAIHRFGPRSSSPFVAVNCANLPEHFIETELFGYGKKSGIAGANPDGKAGKFELADSGVLFLDEIGDMPLSAQAKVLRVLQDNTFERLSSNTTHRVDVHIIAATNKSLENMIVLKQFREDLFYRLNIGRIHMPPLSMRHDDIPLLVEHFITKHSRDLGCHVESVTSEAIALLATQSWPGNIRELENTIKSALVYADNAQDQLSVNDIKSAIERLRSMSNDCIVGRLERAKDENIKQYLDRRKKEEIQNALREAGNNQKSAAALLGLPPSTLSEWMASFGLRSQ